MLKGGFRNTHTSNEYLYFDSETLLPEADTL